MTPASGILARGPWPPEAIEATWHDEPFALAPAIVQAADRALAALRGRGSPSHDGLAARLRGYAVD
ncbi:MAG: NUDIX hydrolase, partial [Solirubrobacteraceae bacterium]